MMKEKKKYLKGTRIEDLTGMKFNHWTVLWFDGITEGRTKWKCQCDCSNNTIKSVEAYSIKNGVSKSCGCLKYKKPYIDLSGIKVNMLTVIERTDKRNNSGKYLWDCVCDCGNHRLVTSDQISLKNVFSCGCTKKKMSRRSKDITGMKFNMLTVIAEDFEYTNKSARYWKCRCDCGNILSVYHYNLTNLKQISCGCYEDRVKREKALDLTGERFGRLVATHRDTDRERRELEAGNSPKTYWICKCDCGNETSILTSGLRSVSSGTKSCGCLQKEVITKWNKNRGIRLNGSFGEWCDSNLGHEFLKSYWSDKNECSAYETPYASRDYVYLICDKCGTEYYLSAYNFTLAMQRHDCGVVSKGEEIMKIILNNNHIEYETQKKFEDCYYKSVLKFDFYIDSMKAAIEVDGEQHREPIEFFGGDESFRKTVIRDEIKDKYCENSGIRLIRIPYEKGDVSKFQQYCNQILIENNIITNIKL